MFSENEIVSPVIEKGSPGGATREDGIKPLEQRALNFLVNEYLLLNDDKLTSVTFSEENEEQVTYIIDFIDIHIFDFELSHLIK